MSSHIEQFQAIIAGLESAGLTRTEIARKAGVSRMTVWRLASGEGRDPLFSTISRLQEISEKFGSGKPVIQKRG